MDDLLWMLGFIVLLICVIGGKCLNAATGSNKLSDLFKLFK